MIHYKKLAAFFAAAAIAAAAHIPAGAAELKYQRECSVVAALGIIDDISDGDFSPEDAISRAEFLSYVMSATGQDRSGSDTPAYIDVRPDYWAAGFIESAKRLGIVSGYNNDYFRPDKEITYSEAARLLVAGLGYGGVAEQRGGFPGGYMQTAGGLGILDGTALANDEAINKETAVKMIYNSLDVPVMTLESIGADSSYKTDKNVNLLTEYHDIYYESGIVDANSLTGLLGEATAEGRVKIDGERYRVGATAAEDMIGCSVKFYYRYDKENDDKTLLYIEGYKNTTQEFLTDRIKSFSEHTYEVYKTGENSSASYKAKISAETDVIYNGKAIAKYTGEHLVPDYGNIRLIDNDNDGVYEVAIIDSWNVMVVQSYQADIGMIYDKYDQTKIDLDDFEEYVITDEQGKQIQASVIKEYSVLLVSVSEDGKYAKIIISNKSVSGEITSVNEDTAETEVTIGGNEYKAGTRFPRESLSERGRSSTYYFDANGRLQAVKAGATLGTQYGYLVKARIIENDEGEETAWLKIFTSEGKFISATAATEKLKLDGVPKVEPNAVRNKLLNDGGTIRQVIGYRINSDGEICMIDTAGEMLGSDDTLLREYSGTGRYKKRAASVGGKVGLASNTIVFSVPADTSDEDERSFTAGNLSMIANDTEFNNGYVAYRTVKESPLSNILLINDMGGSGVMKEETFAVIIKVRSELNEDDEPVAVIKYIKSGTVCEAKCADDTVMKNIKDFSGKNHHEYPIGRGDTVRLALNSRGEISDIELHYDYSEQKMMTANDPGSFTAAPGIMLMNVYDKYEDMIVTTAKTPEKGMTAEKDSFVYFKAGNYDLIVYDEDLDEYAKTGSVADINDFVHSGTYSKVYVSTWYGEPLSMVIYR